MISRKQYAAAFEKIAKHFNGSWHEVNDLLRIVEQGAIEQGERNLKRRIAKRLMLGSWTPDEVLAALSGD